MSNEKEIAVLNTLVEINNDRIEGYATASNETNEADLKSFFTELSHTSEKCKNVLVSEVKKLGGTPIEGTKVTGKFFRVWMDVKAAITGKDRKAILNSCEFGEDMAVNTYEKAIKNELETLTPGHIALLMEQYELIKADHDKVKAMRDELVEKA